MPTAVERLQGLTATSKIADIAPILKDIATSRPDDSISYLRNALGQNGNDAAKNVASAALTGMLPGGASMSCERSGESRPYAVDPFLNELRIAMLDCPPLQPKLKENAAKYLFYPEFTSGGATVKDRIVRLAMAHSGMDPKNTEFVPLYSLGGFFTGKVVRDGLPKPFATGTTCIMTARAVYHSAGAEMIGQRVPTVNTPNGMDVDLGVPSIKSRSFQNQKTMRWEVQNSANPEVVRQRFDDSNQACPPDLAPGDIYFISGHGEAKYLIRPGRLDLAGHVGIVTARAGSIYSTVDGGQGSGASIERRDNRTLKYCTGAGWSFGDSSSFTEDQLGSLQALVDWYGGTPELLERWLREHPAGANLLPNLMLAKSNWEKATQPADKMNKRKAYDFLLAAGKRLIIIVEGGRLHGTVRTVQGWWKPGAYSAIDAVTPAVVRAALG